MNETTPTSEERTWGAAAHLMILLNLFNVLFGVIGCVIVYVLSRSRGTFARDQAAEALNFELTLALVLLALFAGMLCLFFAGTFPSHTPPASVIVLGFLGAIAWLGSIVMAVVAALRAQNGEPFRYPVALRFVR